MIKFLSSCFRSCLLHTSPIPVTIKSEKVQMELIVMCVRVCVPVCVCV